MVVLMFINSVYNFSTIKVDGILYETKKNFEDIEKMFLELQSKYKPAMKGCNLHTFHLNQEEEKKILELIKNVPGNTRYWDQ